LETLSTFFHEKVETSLSTTNRKRGKINAHWNGAMVNPSFEKEETDGNLMVYRC